jgi:hypothetical protein
MSGGQAASGVTMRNDLKDLMEEINWSEDVMLSAEKILPTIDVMKDSSYYPVLSREERMRVPNTSRGPGGTYNRAQWEWSQATYSTKEYGFEEPIDLVQAMLNKDWVDEEEVAAQLAVEGLLLSREARVAAAVFNATTFTGATNFLDITYQWDAPTTAVPWANIEAAWQACRGKCGLAKKQFSLIISEDNINYALKTSEIVNSMLYTEAVASMSSQRKLQFLVDYFGIKDIILVNTLFESTKAGNATPAMGTLWSNEYAMLAVICPPTASWKVRGLGRQPNYKPYASNYLIEDYAEPAKKQHIIRAAEFRGETIRTDYGFLLGNMKTTVSATTGI